MPIRSLLARTRGPLLGALFLLVLLIARSAASLLQAPSGLSATYFANAEFSAPFERSVEYRGRDATRVERRLAFGRPGLPDLPLFFFNDVRRFNFHQRGEPERSQLPFSARWQGYAWVEEGDRARTFFLRGHGAHARLQIDEAAVVQIDPQTPEASAPVFFPKGWRHIVVSLSVPHGGGRRFEAGFLDPVTGRERMLGDDTIYRAPVTARHRRIDRIARYVLLALDLLFIGSLGAFALKALSTPFLALAWLVAIGEAILFALPAYGKLLLQPGGDDSLTYETQARDIVINGPLMLLGSATGEAEAYYYQPLYGYAIAVSHWLFGEDLFGLFLLQRLCLWITLLMIWRITERLFGRHAGIASLVVGGAFLYGVMVPWAWTLWTENAFVPLVVAWTLLLIELAGPGAGFKNAVAAGAVGGLAILSRSTLLPALIVVMPMVAMVRRQARATVAPVVLAVAVLGAVVSLATVRNWIASGTFVPITTSFPINLYLGNTPPPEVPVHDVTAHRGYAWLARDDRTRMVVEFARHAPVAFLTNVGRKALYVLGVFEPLVPGAGYSPALIVTWIAALAGLWIALRGNDSRAGLAIVSLLPAAVGLSMFLVVTIIFPSHPRLILPIYVVMLPYVAAAVGAAGRRLSLKGRSA